MNRITLCETEMWAEIGPLIESCKTALVTMECEWWRHFENDNMPPILRHAYAKDLDRIAVAQRHLDKFKMWCLTGKYARDAEFNDIGEGI